MLFIKCLHLNQLICSKKLQFLHQLQMLELLCSVVYKLEMICLILQVVQQSVRPCLVELSEDPDVDVRYFAGLALETCDQYMLT